MEGEKKMTDEKELGKAIKEGRSEIVIDGDLVNHVYKIKFTGGAAWAICIGAIGVAVISILAVPATGGTSAPVSSLVAAPALAGTTAILGVGATGTAIGIAVAAGGVGALNKLRDYDIEKISDTKAILRKRK